MTFCAYARSSCSNVVKERLKLPLGAPLTRQVFPRGVPAMRKTLVNRGFPAGTTDAHSGPWTRKRSARPWIIHFLLVFRSSSPPSKSSGRDCQQSRQRFHARIQARIRQIRGICHPGRAVGGREGSPIPQLRQGRRCQPRPQPGRCAVHRRDLRPGDQRQRLFHGARRRPACAIPATVISRSTPMARS